MDSPVVFFYILSVNILYPKSAMGISAQMGYLEISKAKLVDSKVLGEVSIVSVGVVGCTLECVRDKKCTVSVHDKTTQQCWFMTNETREQLLTDVRPGDPADQVLTVVVTDDHLCNTEVMPVAQNCKAHYNSGHYNEGLYAIRGKYKEAWILPCHMRFDGPDWTVIQRRVDDTVSFYRSWQDYKLGFGDLDGNLWLGLEAIYKLCQDNCELYAYLVAEPGNNNCSAVDTAYAHYTIFSLADETDAYRLTISGYSGTAGDGLAFGNGQQFTTFDQDNDVMADNCAHLYKGGWWYSNCHSANPNGLYLDGPHPGVYAQGIDWNAYKTYYYSLKYMEIRVKANQST